MIDAFVSNQPHYVPYVAAVLAAVPKRLRGRLYLGQSGNELAAYARRWPTVELASGLPPELTDQPVIVAGYQDIAAVPTSRLLVYVEHGAGQSYADRPDHPAYSGGTGRERVSLHLVPNSWTAEKTLAAWPDTPTVVIGDPTLDENLRTHLDLVDPDGIARDSDLGPDDRLVAVTFHWDGSQIAPEAGTGWHSWAYPVLRLREIPGIRLLGHAHPRIAHALGAWWAEHDVEYEPDRDRILERADVLVAENTSLLWQAARIGIPTVVLDCPFYRPDAARHGPPRFDWHSGVGLQIGDPAALPGAVVAAGRSVPGPVRDVFDSVARDVYPYIGTESADRIERAVLAAWG